jgi:hypothetical protein
MVVMQLVDRAISAHAKLGWDDLLTCQEHATIPHVGLR